MKTSNQVRSDITSKQVNIQNKSKGEMARKNPMPEREIEICRRLKKYRAATNTSQVAFAREAGIDSSMLGNLEHCRTPLRYEIAQKICLACDVNPKWLATGEGKAIAGIDLPSLQELKLPDRSLFSKIYDDYLSADIEREIKEKKNRANYEGNTIEFGDPSDPKIRLAAEDLVYRELKEWIIKIPDSSLDDFVNNIIANGEALISSYPKDSKEIIEKRSKEIQESRIWLEDRRIRLKSSRI